MRRAFVIATALLCAPGVSRAQERAKEPYEIVRSMTEQQDRLSASDAGAQDEQAALAAEFVRRATGADDRTWRSARNRRAVALFLLAGGESDPLKPVIARMKLEGDEKNLLEGALAFAEGREKDALATLGALEPRNLPADVGGQVALTQGVLNLGVDRGKAMQALDLARLLSPGALVEEAALRRQVFIASEGDDPVRFVALSERYRIRFRHSTYASNFQTRFREGFVRFWISGDERVRVALERMFADAPKQEGEALLLHTARMALARGALPAAKAAAARMRAYSDPAGPMAARAQLYDFAASVLDDGANADAVAPDASRLPLEDRVLREAANLARAARKPRREGEASAASGEPTPLMRKAGELIAEADAMRGAPR